MPNCASVQVSLIIAPYNLFGLRDCRVFECKKIINKSEF